MCRRFRFATGAVLGLAVLAALLSSCTKTGAPKDSPREAPQSPTHQDPAKGSLGDARLRLWVPAYYYPFGDGLKIWDRLIGRAGQAPIVAIVNPDSGPGKKVDTNYAAVVKRARQAGLTLVGYVGTQYTKRPLADVKAEVDTWLHFYPVIQGIHFDEQPSDAGKVDYFVELYKYVHAKVPGALVLTNPGTPCAEEYVSRPASDVVCLFERDKGFADFQPPPWANRYQPGRLAVQAYQVETPEKMRQYLHEVVGKRVGYVFITDAKGANPYDRLPSYWDAEVAAVARANR